MPARPTTYVVVNTRTVILRLRALISPRPFLEAKLQHNFPGEKEKESRA